MKNLSKLQLTAGLVCVAMMCSSLAAQITTTVAPNVPAGDYFYPGSTVTVELGITVNVGKNAAFSATFDVSCDVDGITVYSPAPYQVTVLNLPYAQDTRSFTVSESSTGTYSVVCTVSGDLSGGVTGSFSGSGSTSFTVVSCTGDANYTENGPTAQGDIVETTWVLSSIMNPPNPNNQTESYGGFGVTGNLVGGNYAYDCGGSANPDTAEAYPEIEELPPQQTADDAINFYYNLIDFSYDASSCSACDAYPGNYYDVTVSAPQKTTEVLTGYCAATK